MTKENNLITLRPWFEWMVANDCNLDDDKNHFELSSTHCCAIQHSPNISHNTDEIKFDGVSALKILSQVI